MGQLTPSMFQSVLNYSLLLTIYEAILMDGSFNLHFTKSSYQSPVAKSARHLVMLCKFFCVYRPYKESISKEMNNDDLNLHSMTKLSGWLRYCQPTRLL